jgi:hypothetical protein
MYKGSLVLLIDEVVDHRKPFGDVVNCEDFVDFEGFVVVLKGFLLLEIHY